MQKTISTIALVLALLTILLLSPSPVASQVGPDALRHCARLAFSTSEDFVAQGIGTLGIFVGGLLGSAIGTRRALFVAALGTMLAIVWLLASPVRHMDNVKT